MRLPDLAPETEASRPAEPGSSETTARRRVLVVDDNEDAAASLAMLLEMAGHDVRAAHDGIQALSAAGDFRPEVVLLDIGLPGMNGYEVARQIRGQEWGAAMMLIALTGWGQDSDRAKSREAGFDRHLVKPVDPEALLAMLGASAPAEAKGPSGRTPGGRS